MTVCLAGMFRYNHGIDSSEDWGKAIITVSDRMITAGDVQYEPLQRKTAHITPHILAMIAGDYSTHSQALIEIHTQIKGDRSRTPYQVALMYGRALQGVKLKEAEDIILAPLGLNADTFLAQQKEMAAASVVDLNAQLQGYSGQDVEAIVAGFDPVMGAFHVYQIDTRGTVRCLDDVGFAAIGIGAWHAKSRLMQVGYTNNWNISAALSSLFAAKKAAEIAPGVGKSTDIHLITRGTILPIWEPVAAKIEELFTEFSTTNIRLAGEAISKLGDFIEYATKTANAGEQKSFLDEAGENTSGVREDTG